MSFTQKQRKIQISTPLGEDVLLFYKMHGVEKLNQAFEYQLELLSTQAGIDPGKILGKSITVKLILDNGQWRYFNGYVTRFGNYGKVKDFIAYRAVIRPWLWFLSRASNCRIFQNKSVPDIIKQVFHDQGFSDFKIDLIKSYSPREYCVQYRETDFNFVNRLMEEEGICYYNTHKADQHILNLVDDVSSHHKYTGYETIPYHQDQGSNDSSRSDHIYTWGCAQEVHTGSYQLTDYDFKNPKANLLAKSQISKSHTHDNFEFFDYPGHYTNTGVGETLARHRIEELHSDFIQAEGQANARGIAVGYLFKLQDFPANEQNKQYLITSAEYDLIQDEFLSQNTAVGEKFFDCRFTALDSAIPFRPPRISPKTLVHGAQTALVVGPSGDEIFTDKYGRVKVQFHWDRYGKNDQDSSCWVRVSHPWAGKNWGMVAIPRIGHEVVVDFLEGDADQPLIVGSVYNADMMPPYDLPANATQTGIKSRSSKSGSPANYNEFRFEDKKGSEMVLLHAEKDQTIEVEHDEAHSVGHDRSKTVDNNETVNIGKNRSETVGENETISIGKNRAEDVGENETISIGKNRDETVAQNETISIGKNRDNSIGENETSNVGKNQTLEVGENRKATIGKDDMTQVGKKYYLEAGDEITLKTGDASISLKKDGTIQIKGKDITLIGSGKIGVKASSDLTLKGSKIAQN
jgi:type VI secretion system secreted protein VgrG